MGKRGGRVLENSIKWGDVFYEGPLREFEDDMFTTAMARANKTKLFLALHQGKSFISCYDSLI